MTKAVFFDMDGVIIDSEQFYFERRLAFLKDKQEAPGTKCFNDYIGADEKTIWELLILDDEEKRNRLKKEYQNYRKKNEIDFMSAMISGFNEALLYLKRKSIKVAIVSSASNYQINKLITACQLAGKIDFYISGEEFEKSKPDPAIYKYAIKKSNVEKDEILVVEDSEVGISAAKSAGLKVAAIKYKHMNQKQADYYFVDHFDLIDLIRNKG